jgi:hypothetical protein
MTMPSTQGSALEVGVDKKAVQGRIRMERGTPNLLSHDTRNVQKKVPQPGRGALRARARK